MKLNEQERQEIKGYLTEVEQRTNWIGQVLKSNHAPVPSDAVIVSLGVGQSCEELVHLRKIAGPDATLIAFDIMLPNPNGVLVILGTQADFQIKDINLIDRLTASFPKPPSLIISRHPQIAQHMDRDGNIISYNDWWLSCLTKWAQYALKTKSQMITTHYISEEQQRLNSCMQKAGLHPKTDTNHYYPRELDRFPKARPDGFTITIS